VRRIDLPSGGWAELRERPELRLKHTNMVENAFMAAGGAIAKLPDKVPDLPEDPEERVAALAKVDMSDLMQKGFLTFEEMQSFQRLKAAAVVAFLVAWSRGSVPTLDTVEDLNADVAPDLDAISMAVRDDIAAVLSGLNFSPTPKVEPGNPTGPSSDSNGHSRDEDVNRSTPASPSGIANSSSES
jgi:hypothetical protein